MSIKSIFTWFTSTSNMLYHSASRSSWLNKISSQTSVLMLRWFLPVEWQSYAHVPNTTSPLFIKYKRCFDALPLSVLHLNNILLLPSFLISKFFPSHGEKKTQFNIEKKEMKFLRIRFTLYPSNVINEFASSYQKNRGI